MKIKNIAKTIRLHVVPFRVTHIAKRASGTRRITILTKLFSFSNTYFAKWKQVQILLKHIHFTFYDGVMNLLIIRVVICCYLNNKWNRNKDKRAICSFLCLTIILITLPKTWDYYYPTNCYNNKCSLQEQVPNTVVQHNTLGYNKKLLEEKSLGGNNRNNIGNKT